MPVPFSSRRARKTDLPRPSRASVRSSAALFVALLAAVSSASAQINTATLFVQVSTAGGTALAGVTIELTQPDTGLTRSAVTDEGGRTLIQALPPGPYEVVALHDGMDAPAMRTLRLMIGQRAELHLVLDPQVEETMTVAGRVPLVDVHRLDSSTNILPEQIETLPVADRQYERLVFLSPGAQRDRSQYFNRTGAPVTGSSGTSSGTTFLMDGANFTDRFFGLARARVSQDAIDEFRVVAHRFDTEIGGSTGGAISVITKSGTNSLQGSVFGFYRADDLRATGVLETDGVDFSRSHFGLTLGGPIRPDKTHYFVSAESIEQDDIALFRPGGAFVDLAADFPHPLDQNLALVSLDHQLRDSSSLVAKLAYEYYREENYQVGGIQAESQGFGVHRDHWNLLLGHSWVLGTTRLNELRLQAGRSQAQWPMNSAEMEEFFSMGSTMKTGRAWNGAMWGDAEYLEARNTLHMAAGDRHQLKTGFSYQYVHGPYQEERFDAGQMRYLTDDRSLPFVYTYGQGSSRTAFQSEEISVYAQDDWRVRPDLTLSLGLRYDTDIGGNNPDFEHPLLSGRRDTDWDNLQPRIGFTWDLSGDGSGVLRGGAGLFSGRYLAYPTLSELGFNDLTGRVSLLRINGALVPGLPPLWLDPADPENTGVPLPPSIQILSDELAAPEAMQITLGYSHRLGGSGLHLDIEGVYVEGDREHVLHDRNWAGNQNPGRIYRDYTWVLQTSDGGHSRYEALTLGLNGNVARRHLIAASLTWASKRNTADDPLTLTFASDSADLDAEWGRASTDEHLRLVLSGVFRLGWDLTLAPFYEYGSGQPWNRLLGYDYNGDLWVTDRPPGVPRNGEDGPPFRQLNLRLGKEVRLSEQASLELLLDVFNLFDTTNYAVSSVDRAMFFSGPTLLFPGIPAVPNPRFGRYTATHSPREIQLGLRYRF